MKKFLRDQRGNFGLVLKQYYGFEIGRQVFITAACDYICWKDDCILKQLSFHLQAYRSTMMISTHPEEVLNNGTTRTWSTFLQKGLIQKDWMFIIALSGPKLRGRL
jgi:hypothetical protein